MASRTETMILLLPELDSIEESAKNSLLKKSGVISVAVHSFDGLNQQKKRW
jgi:hypothetical protein